jgi:hypothetical protein
MDSQPSPPNSVEAPSAPTQNIRKEVHYGVLQAIGHVVFWIVAGVIIIILAKYVWDTWDLATTF